MFVLFVMHEVCRVAYLCHHADVAMLSDVYIANVVWVWLYVYICCLSVAICCNDCDVICIDYE